MFDYIGTVRTVAVLRDPIKRQEIVGLTAVIPILNLSDWVVYDLRVAVMPFNQDQFALLASVQDEATIQVQVDQLVENGPKKGCMIIPEFSRGKVTPITITFSFCDVMSWTHADWYYGTQFVRTAKTPVNTGKTSDPNGPIPTVAESIPTSATSATSLIPVSGADVGEPIEQDPDQAVL